MAPEKSSTNLDDDDVEEFIEKEVNEEYDVAFKQKTHRAADFGSLMVSLRMVANQLDAWTQKGMLPEVEELEEKREMIEDALSESPIDTLDPENNEFDEKMVAIVDYAEELKSHLKNLKSAREIVNEANHRISRYEQEFELLRD